MEMTIPTVSWQLLCQCLSSHVWERGCFSNCIQNIVGRSRRIYCSFLSQSNKTLKYFQLLASLVNRTLFPWSLWKLSSRVHFMSTFIPAETTKFSFNQPRCVPRGSEFPGVGTLELSNPPGWGRGKRANAPSSSSTATFFIDRTVEYCRFKHFNVRFFVSINVLLCNSARILIKTSCRDDMHQFIILVLM